MLRKILALLAAVFGVLFWLPRLFRRAERIDWKDAPRPGRLIDVDGVQVHYLDEGSGPAIVMVHGFGGHTFSFRRLVPDLSKDHRVVAPDMMGFGYTERPRGRNYSMTSQAKLVLGLMDRLGIEKTTLLGHSMGGEVAMRMAATAPDRVEKLILAASVPGDRFWTLPPMPLLKLFFPPAVRLFGRRVFQRIFYDKSMATDDVRRAYDEPGLIRGHIDGVYQVIKDMRRDKPIRFSDIRAPVIIIWAEAERILPGIALRRLRKRFPQAEVVTVAKTGHVLLEEQPADCLSPIRRFLRGAGAQSPELEAAEAAVE